MNTQAEHPAGPPGSAAPFVGRQREIAELRSAVGDALRGRGALFLVAGEPGIGKTRLADEVALSASEQGFRLLAGRCWEGEGAPPFWPWVQVLRACSAPGEGAAAPGNPTLPGNLDELVRLPDGDAPAWAPDSEHARFYLFDRVTRLLRSASEAGPLFLFLDDLQWADEPSLRLLEFLAPGLRESRILTLGTYRDVDLASGGRLAGRLGALARTARHLSLRGLDSAEVRLFIEGTTGRTADPRFVVSALEATGGNPFFLEEILRGLPAEPGREARLRVPGGVRAAIRRRLEGLSDECRAALAVAAVIGRELDVRVLEEASGVSPAGLLAVLDEAEAAGIVVGDAQAPGRYAFSHDLVRETLYGGSSASRRLEIHRDVALAVFSRHVVHVSG